MPPFYSQGTGMNQISYTLGPGRCLCRGDTQMGCQPVYINGAGETGRDFYFIEPAHKSKFPGSGLKKSRPETGSVVD
jgi:hypothetical protein